MKSKMLGIRRNEGTAAFMLVACFIGFLFAPLEAGVKYGIPYHGDSLINMRVGVYAGWEVAFRFKAQNSGYVNQVKWYNVYSSRPGYHGLTGGALLVQIQTDNPSAHMPSGNVLTQFVFDGPAWKGAFPLKTFDSPVYLSEGVLYHIVFINIHPDRQTHYISVNTLQKDVVASPRQPGINDLDLATLRRGSPAADWYLEDRGAPIYQLNYTDGFKQGFGYMAVGVNYPKRVIYSSDGELKVRQGFNPSSAMVVNSMSVRLKKVGDPVPLRAEITDASGNILAYGDRRFTDSDYVWIEWEFDSLTLFPDQQYYVVFRLTSDSGTSGYEFFPILEGAMYGFSPNTYYSQGRAEYQDGIASAWKGWKVYSADDRNDCDLQLYFDVD